MPTDTGPFLKAAVFCGDVIEGKDGVLSLIRVIDRLTIAAAGQQAPPAMPQVPQLMKLVLMLVSGRARGNHEVAVRMEQPDTTAKDLWKGTLFLEGEDRGNNLVVETQVTFENEGLYWFDISFDGELVTRMPFRVIYQRAVAGTASP